MAELEPRIVPFSDVLVLLDERRRLWERIEKADDECGRLRERLADTETEKIERGTEILRLREQLDAAQREVACQMQSKLDAQVTLKAVTEALDLRFDELGSGWREAAPKILARIETIVDEADRAFRERDAARAALGVGQ